MSSRAVADLSAGKIVATVEIAAPPARVFQAIGDADEIPRWWGSADTYRTTSHTADLRPGGKWRSDGIGQDGHAFHVGGELLTIDPPRLLTMTWNPSWDEQPTTVSYRLEPPADGGTRLTVRHEGFADRAESCKAHGEGWERVLGWLAAYATGGQ